MSHRQTIDLQQHREPLLKILTAVVTQPDISRKQLDQLLRDYPKGHDGTYSRDDLILAYRTFAGDSLPPYEQAVLERLRRKPVRTSSGVTPVTVLTKPYPCPGECIFCPNDVRMPKSYLSDEPGAQRAEQNSFDPYLQTYTRLQSYHNTGHPTDKIEIIVLGGTWSFYPESYQIWFIKRILSQLHPDRNTTTATIDGLHIDKRYNAVVQMVYKDEMLRSTDLAQAISRGEVERSPVDEYATWAELEAAHLENETAPCRSVGLVIETRPDHISVDEVLRVRRLGNAVIKWLPLAAPLSCSV